jgi:hypothetical protein
MLQNLQELGYLNKIQCKMTSGYRVSRCFLRGRRGIYEKPIALGLNHYIFEVTESYQSFYKRHRNGHTIFTALCIPQ